MVAVSSFGWDQLWSLLPFAGPNIKNKIKREEV